MEEVERVSRLIGDIYDASLDPELWSAVFEKVGGYVQGSTAFVASQDTVTKTAQFYFNWGTEPRYVQLYLESYCKLNPVLPTILLFGVGDTVSVPDILPREEFCRTRFAKEWLGPQGYVDGLLGIVDKSATSCAVFSVFRRLGDGFIDDEMRRRFELIAPHVRRALLIGKVINLHKVQAAQLADSLDTLAAGMFLVDATSHIAYTNASGQELLREARILRAPSGRLGATDPVADQALQETFARSAQGDAAVGRRGIAVTLRTRDGERYVANVLPLTSGARRNAGTVHSATAVVFVHRVTLDMPSPPEVLAREFRLTPAELRVLFAIIEIGNAGEVADVLGISEATVRTHLHHLYGKTSTNRQTELVRLVAGYSNAVMR
jgi:DNA-binding CsgD family transcriptional regulator